MKLVRLTDGKAKPEGKRPLGRSRHRWVCNIKKDHGEIVRGVLIGLY
jgi:hypothetical protein